LINVNADTLPTAPGTYLLKLHLAAPDALQAGRLGRFTLSPGDYLYVGSAHGPGGLRARVGRHLRRDKTAHWHIDALTARAPVVAVWYDRSSRRLECRWAQALAAAPCVTIPIPRFGASDCGCAAHLFALPHDIPFDPADSTPLCDSNTPALGCLRLPGIITRAGACSGE
jgi:Uri superfamily endonuclease